MSQYVRDKKFFIEKIVIYEQELYGYLMMFVESPQTAEDLLQNTFEKAWKQIGQLRERDKARGWLFSITRNEISRYYRDLHHSVFYVDDMVRVCDENLTVEISREDALESLIRDFDIETLRTALLRLESKYRKLIMMHYFEGLNQREIAEILDQKHSTVRVNLVRALNKVREIRAQIERGEAL